MGGKTTKGDSRLERRRSGTLIAQCGVLEGISKSVDGKIGDEGGRDEDKGCGNMTSGEAMAIK